VSSAVQKKLEGATRSIERNSPRVERNLERVQRTADTAVLHSTAKYYDTLKKLARQ
jgi:hypothetical protein